MSRRCLPSDDPIVAARVSQTYCVSWTARLPNFHFLVHDRPWGVDYVVESNVVDRRVRNLRAKLQNGWRRLRFIPDRIRATRVLHHWHQARGAVREP